MHPQIKQRLDAIARGEVPEGFKVSRLGTVPLDWENFRFSGIFEARDNRTSDTKKFPLYSLTIENGVVPKTERYERSFLISKDDDFYKVVLQDDFVYNPMNLRFGAIGRHKENSAVCVSGYYDVFFIKNGFSDKYMEVFLKSRMMIAYYNAMATGSLIEKQRVHFSQFMEFNLPLPPLNEQQKIASILAHCDKVVELKQKLIDELRRRKKWLMQMLLDPNSGVRLPGFLQRAKQVKIGDICLVFSGGTPNRAIIEYYGGNIPFIRSAEIEQSTTELSITMNGMKNSSAKMIKRGDLLYALYGANSGECAISKIEGAINQAILCIRSNYVEIVYLYYMFCFNKENIVKNYIQGGQGNLSAEIVKSISFPIPPTLPEQAAIANILSAADDKISLHEQELNEWQKKKKSLMQLLLTGIVRVK